MLTLQQECNDGKLTEDDCRNRFKDKLHGGPGRYTVKYGILPKGSKKVFHKGFTTRVYHKGVEKGFDSLFSMGFDLFLSL